MGASSTRRQLLPPPATGAALADRRGFGAAIGFGRVCLPACVGWDRSVDGSVDRPVDSIV